jgi:hypothetical protein
MTDVFISHSAVDQPLAEFLHRHLEAEGVSVYLASMATRPGEQWMPAIMTSLQASQWVICLASRAACASPWVMQEMGAAIGTKKKLIPVVWDQSPAELPAWMRQYQAVELGRDNQTARRAISRIAESIRADKQRGIVIVSLLIAGIAIFGR